MEAQALQNLGLAAAGMGRYRDAADRLAEAREMFRMAPGGPTTLTLALTLGGIAAKHEAQFPPLEAEIRAALAEAEAAAGG